MLVKSYGTRQSHTADCFARGVESHAELYFLTVSPVNAKLTSPSYVHQDIFLSSETYTVAIVTPTTNFVSALFFPLIVHPRLNAI